MIIQLLAALGGTIGFSILYSTPKEQYVSCGLTGMVGWAVFLLLTRFAAFSAPAATFCATFIVAILARIVARIRKCPATVFLITGIFPLIPGGSIYWTAYYLVMNDSDLAAHYGFLAMKIVFALVLGIVFVQDIPKRIFRVFKREDTVR